MATDPLDPRPAMARGTTAPGWGGTPTAPLPGPPPAPAGVAPARGAVAPVTPAPAPSSPAAPPDLEDEPAPPARRRRRLAQRRAAPRRRGDQVRRARRVTRVIRRVELWSVLKVALLLNTCVYGVALAASAAMWAVAHRTGLVEQLTSFLGDVGFENFTFDGEEMFRRVAAIGAILVLSLTTLAVLATSLVNLISELTGGIRVVIIEEELVDASSTSRT